MEQAKHEINFWNGKCTTLKRDLEYGDRYNEKLKDEKDKVEVDLSTI